MGQAAAGAAGGGGSHRSPPLPTPSSHLRLQAPGAEPYTLLDAGTWQVQPKAVAPLLSATNADFSVVAALGGQGLGKSALLNRLLGLAGPLRAPAAQHPTPAFPTSGAAAAAAGRHCTRGVELRVGAQRLVALDSQPLFSASVLEGMAARWDQPPPALAGPAAAAASDAKAPAVPYEGVQALAQLQLAVLMLAACHRVLVLCDGLADRATWELLITAEMLARGVPDPSLPPRDAAATAAASSGQASAQQAAAPPRQAPPQEHLAEVVLVHVLPRGDPLPSVEQLRALEARLDAYFASSRLRRPGGWGVGLGLCWACVQACVRASGQLLLCHALAASCMHS